MEVDSYWYLQSSYLLYQVIPMVCSEQLVMDYFISETLLCHTDLIPSHTNDVQGKTAYIIIS